MPRLIRRNRWNVLKRKKVGGSCYQLFTVVTYSRGKIMPFSITALSITIQTMQQLLASSIVTPMSLSSVVMPICKSHKLHQYNRVNIEQFTAVTTAIVKHSSSCWCMLAYFVGGKMLSTTMQPIASSVVTPASLSSEALPFCNDHKLHP